ncbi:hypothetical protein BH10PSE4_BH10PSE4_20860 [soil metagenome]
MDRRVFLLGAGGALAAAGPAWAEWPPNPYSNMDATGPKALPDNGIVLCTVQATDFTLVAPTAPDILFRRQEGGKDFRLTSKPQRSATVAGVYALAQYIRPAMSQYYSFNPWGVTPESRISFTVGPGEVIYIGHIDIRAKGRIVSIDVADQLADLQSKIPEELAGKVQTRLLQAPPTVNFGAPTFTTLR